MAKRKSSRSSGENRLLGWISEVMPEMEWPTLPYAGRIAAWSIAAVALVASWAVGVPVLQRYASAQTPTVTEIDVRFADAPAWVHEQLESRLAQTTRSALKDGPLAQDDLAAARDALLATGWFDKVRQVRRTSHDAVVVEAVFAQPYAVVRDEHGDHLIDPSGRLLPQSFSFGQKHRFTVIDNALYPRPLRPGEPWEGADIVAALRLKRVIDPRPWHRQVRAIDVTEYQKHGTLHLVTDNGYRIRWGSAPGEERAGEVTTERKIYYLDHPFNRHGHIDGGYEGDLDITDPQGVFGK